VRVLIVEDNEPNRDMLSRRLRRRGWEVACAVDGEEGLTMALADPPHLVLLDLGLPKLDGWVVAERLRASPRTRHVPIVALTAHVTDADRERALAAGCDHFATKPVVLPTLLQIMDGAVRGRPPGGGA